MINKQYEVDCLEKNSVRRSTFYYSTLFLNSEQRHSLHTVFEFHRTVEAIVKKYNDLYVARTKLDWWRKEISRVFSSTPQHPLGRALVVVCQKYSVQESLFLDILQGMEMDLTFQGYQTFDDLRLYCHRVANALSLLTAEILGYQNQNTLHYARELGMALQWIRMIRNVGKDSLQGRVYFPEEDLEKFQLKAQSLLQRQYSDSFYRFMEFQSARAKSFYQQAQACLPASDRKNQASGLVMAKIYHVLLNEIEKSHFQVLSQDIQLTPLRKLWIAWRTFRRLQKGKSL